MIWLKNTGGKKDSMFTFAVIAFVVVTVRILLGTFSVSWGDKVFAIHDMDSGLATAYLSTTFAAYWARRHTKTNGKKKK